MSIDTANPRPVQLSAAADDVFAFSYALLLIDEAKDEHGDASEPEKAAARDRLTYHLFLRSQQLRNLVETGNIHGAQRLAGAA